MANPEVLLPTIVGRSSSHFTRTVRMFASELGVEHAFQVVRDLFSAAPGDYADNPALKVPMLKTSDGVWFGALGICRVLARASTLGLHIVWPEQLETPLLANAQELTIQAMATEVGLIMAKAASADEAGAHLAKMRASLRNSMAWLDSRLPQILAGLPAQRDLSYLEVTLYCLTTHLGFRDVLPTAGYGNLTDFCAAFGERASAVATPYRFDP